MAVAMDLGCARSVAERAPSLMESMTASIGCPVFVFCFLFFVLVGSGWCGREGLEGGLEDKGEGKSKGEGEGKGKGARHCAQCVY